MSGWEIRMAEAADMEAVLRLQAKPMEGPIRLSLKTPLRPDDRVIIAYKDGKLMGMGARQRAQHGWGGKRNWVGVLTSFRSDCGVLPRRTVIEMYRRLRASPPGGDPPWELTSILDGNRPARRFLEAGLPGMPRYTQVTQLSTLTFLARPAPVSTLTVVPVVAGENTCKVDRIPGHSSVITGYGPSLARVRPVLDPLLRWTGRPGLPKPGTALRQAFVVDAQWITGNLKGLTAFLDAIRFAAGSLGADVVHWGLPSDHSDASWLKSKLRAWETRSIVYAVHDAELAAPALPDFRPEVSRL